MGDRDGIFTRKGKPGYYTSYIDANGRRRQKRIHATNKTEAKKIRGAILARVEKMRVLGVAEAEDESFESTSQRYLAYQKPRVSEQTYERIEGILTKRLQPAFPGKIGSITRATISDYVTNRLAEASAYTAQKEFNTLKHLLRLAHEEWAIIPVNPAKTLTLKTLGLKVPPGRVRYLHPDELLNLLEHCPVWLRPIVILAIATGLRRGNLVNLRWTQYYERNRQIIIQHTKNNEPVVCHLNDIGLLGLAMAEAQFGRERTGRVFPGVTEDQTSVAFRRAREKAGIENFRFHDLRHTNASWLRMSGADIHTIAVMLGQKDIRMAMRYSHLSADFLADQSRQLDRVFSSLLNGRAKLLNPAEGEQVVTSNVTECSLIVADGKVDDGADQVSSIE
jgi:integrase